MYLGCTWGVWEIFESALHSDQLNRSVYQSTSNNQIRSRISSDQSNQISAALNCRYMILFGARIIWLFRARPPPKSRIIGWVTAAVRVAQHHTTRRTQQYHTKTPFEAIHTIPLPLRCRQNPSYRPLQSYVPRAGASPSSSIKLPTRLLLTIAASMTCTRSSGSLDASW